MKENEFDIYVRNLMADAEETVSPKVWKGVEAGLDKAVRPRAARTVPAWLWRSVAGVAAAAAVVAGIVLLTPDKNLSNQPTIQQPIAETAETEQPLPVPTEPEEAAVPSLSEQVSRLRSVTAYVPEAVTEEAVPETDMTADVSEEAPSEEAAEERKGDSVISPTVRQEAGISDEEAFNRLAFEERKARRGGTFSAGVMGNLQSNTRPDSPMSTVRRTSGMFHVPAPTKTGLFDERPEFSFGLPVSAGIGLRYDFSPRWGIGTGIVYTNLSRSFIANYAEVNGGGVDKLLYDTDVMNQQHYIGIPVNVFFNIVNTGNWNFHARLDGMAEKLISNDFRVHDSEGDIVFSEKVGRPQFSAGLGIGVEFKFTPYLGIYLDPTVRYYFDCGQLRSIRTIQPLRLDFEAGLRFTLGQ